MATQNKSQANLSELWHLRHVGPSSTMDNSSSLIRLSVNGTVTVGRGPTVDFYLDSNLHLRLISRLHASIKGERLANGHIKFVLTNHGLNGTYINDFKLGITDECNAKTLHEGDKVAFGHVNSGSVQVGSYAPQPQSEFQFIFERVNYLTSEPPHSNPPHGSSIQVSEITRGMKNSPKGPITKQQSPSNNCLSEKENTFVENVTKLNQSSKTITSPALVSTVSSKRDKSQVFNEFAQGLLEKDPSDTQDKYGSNVFPDKMQEQDTTKECRCQKFTQAKQNTLDFPDDHHASDKIDFCSVSDKTSFDGCHSRFLCHDKTEAVPRAFQSEGRKAMKAELDHKPSLLYSTKALISSPHRRLPDSDKNFNPKITEGKNFNQDDIKVEDKDLKSHDCTSFPSQAEVKTHSLDYCVGIKKENVLIKPFLKKAVAKTVSCKSGGKEVAQTSSQAQREQLVSQMKELPKFHKNESFELATFTNECFHSHDKNSLNGEPHKSSLDIPTQQKKMFLHEFDSQHKIFPQEMKNSHSVDKNLQPSSGYNEITCTIPRENHHKNSSWQSCASKGIQSSLLPSLSSHKPDSPTKGDFSGVRCAPTSPSVSSSKASGNLQSPKTLWDSFSKMIHLPYLSAESDLTLGKAGLFDSDDSSEDGEESVNNTPCIIKKIYAPFARCQLAKQSNFESVMRSKMSNTENESKKEVLTEIQKAEIQMLSPSESIAKSHKSESEKSSNCDFSMKRKASKSETSIKHESFLRNKISKCEKTTDIEFSSKAKRNCDSDSQTAVSSSLLPSLDEVKISPAELKSASSPDTEYMDGKNQSPESQGRKNLNSSECTVGDTKLITPSRALLPQPLLSKLKQQLNSFCKAQSGLVNKNEGKIKIVPKTLASCNSMSPSRTAPIKGTGAQTCDTKSMVSGKNPNSPLNSRDKEILSHYLNSSTMRFSELSFESTRSESEPERNLVVDETVKKSYKIPKLAESKKDGSDCDLKDPTADNKLDRQSVIGSDIDRNKNSPKKLKSSTNGKNVCHSILISTPDQNLPSKGEQNSLTVKKPDPQQKINSENSSSHCKSSFPQPLDAQKKLVADCHKKSSNRSETDTSLVKASHSVQEKQEKNSDSDTLKRFSSILHSRKGDTQSRNIPSQTISQSDSSSKIVISSSDKKSKFKSQSKKSSLPLSIHSNKKAISNPDIHCYNKFDEMDSVTSTTDAGREKFSKPKEKRNPLRLKEVDSPHGGKRYPRRDIRDSPLKRTLRPVKPQRKINKSDISSSEDEEMNLIPWNGPSPKRSKSMCAAAAQNESKAIKGVSELTSGQLSKNKANSSAVKEIEDSEDVSMMSVHTSKDRRQPFKKRKQRRRHGPVSSSRKQITDDEDSDLEDSWNLPDGVQYFDNPCDAAECKDPSGKAVNWISQTQRLTGLYEQENPGPKEAPGHFCPNASYYKILNGNTIKMALNERAGDV